MATPQKSAMDLYLKELSALVDQRQKLTGRINRLEKVLRGMTDLLDTEEEQMEYMEKLDDITPPSGLSDAIEQVVGSEEGKALFPTEIRDRVKSYLANHSNQMASVHTTLKRIVKKNPLVESVEKDGKTAYRWASMGERMVQDMARRVTTNPGASGNIRNWMALNASRKRNKAFYGEK